MIMNYVSVRIELNKIKNKLVVERVVPNDTLDFVMKKSYTALQKIDYSIYKYPKAECSLLRLYHVSIFSKTMLAACSLSVNLC